MHPQRLLDRGIIALCAIGLLLNLVILRIHANLAASGSEYTSLCNVSTRINCDAVLDSAYASLFGLPVAAWGALAFTVMLALSLLRAARATRALLLLTGWSVGYSAVLAAISFSVLHTVCLMCSGLYLVTAGLFVLAFRRVRREAGTRSAVVAGLVPVGLALAFGYASTAGVATNVTIENLADVRSREPEFYRWYQALPVVAAAAEMPTGPVHAKGPAAAPVTIVEYSDFACSHCARARRDLERLIADRPGEVRLVFRHFPLDTSCNPTLRHSVHPTACEAAMAAECAGELGKFWEFHDYLFDNSQQQAHDYPQAAAALGLDQARFQSCLASGRSRETVARDVAAAASVGVESTPTLFINGRTVRGALDARLYEAALIIEKNRTDHGH